FAYLVAEHGRAVSRDELAEALWDDMLPSRWEKALSVLASKLRAVLDDCGLDGSAALDGAFGCYQLRLPPGTWIDVAEAAAAPAGAGGAAGLGGLAPARSDASAAASLARRPFLPGEDGAWVEQKRAWLHELLVRALACGADAALGSGDTVDAVRAAAELTALEPFRESGYRTLMRAYAARGDNAEALRVYERLRRLLADELGVYPSPE